MTYLKSMVARVKTIWKTTTPTGLVVARDLNFSI